jgi:hypothetical protein
MTLPKLPTAAGTSWRLFQKENPPDNWPGGQSFACNDLIAGILPSR